jgi:FKBP-type peptidyl-prolyl cis-trans isomerase FkpA
MHRPLRRRACIPALLALAALVAGCVAAPTAPSAYAPFAQTDLRVGTGTQAAAGDIVATHYTAWLYDPGQPEQKGAQVDSSRAFGVFEFVLGAGQVIGGWDQGVVGMRAGGLRRLVVPPSLAYGAARNGIIPPNTTLVFEIELVRVGPEPEPEDEDGGTE